MYLLKNRLDAVTERSVLLQVLNDVEKDPDEYIYIVETFIEHLDLFGKFLTPKEFSSRIEPILLRMNPIFCIIGFARKLSTIKNHLFREVMTVLSWLKCVAEANIARVILDSLTVLEDDEETNQMFHEFTIACINIPEKVSNFRAVATSNDHLKYISTVIWTFKHEILQGVQKSLQKTYESSANSNLMTVADFMSTGRNMEIENDNLLVKMMEWIENLPKIDKKWRSIMKRMFMTPTAQKTHVHEAFLTQLFLSVKNEKQLERCIDTSSSAIKNCGILRRVVLIKLPFQRILEPWNTKLLVDFLYNNDEEHVFALLETAIKIWSDSAYARKCPELQEKHIVRLIVYCIHKVKKNLTPAWSDLFLAANQGVYTRMEMMPTYIRSGLFLNSTLAKLADSAVKNQSPTSSQDMRPPENEDYELNVAANEWNDEMKTILKKGILQKAPTSSELKEVVDSTTYIVQSAFENEKRPPAPGPEFWQTSKDSDKPGTSSAALLDSDDEEDFPEYSVDDAEKKFENLKVGEEPKTSVTPPAYIIDAFEMLLEREKMEIFEAAFFRLPHLIQRRSVGFVEVAEKIVIRCLHLQNTFGTRNFDDNVEEIVIGCIVNRPEIVPSLIRLFITAGQGDRIQQRLLHLILKSAEELGNSHRRHTEFIEEQQKRYEDHYINVIHPYRDPRHSDDSDEEEDEEDAYPEWRRIVDARIAAKTRIISSRPRQRPTTSVNRLGQIPQFMFYPLLILPKGDNARLLYKDMDLLALIIMVASMVFVRSGVNPMMISMAKELIAYVTPHRFLDNAKVRAACLSAHLNVVALTPFEILHQTFPVDTRRAWLDYAEMAMAHNLGHEQEIELSRQLGVLLYGHFQRLSDE